MKLIVIWTAFIFTKIFAFELINHPDLNIWAKEGDHLELKCEVDEPWMWCYWEISRTSAFNTSQMYTTTFDDNIVQIDYNSDGIKFILNDRVCGIEIQELDYNLHDGDWKCHIAETNKKPSAVVAEINLITNVAQKADMDFSWKMNSEFSNSLLWPEKQKLNELAHLSCAVDMKVNPTPNFAIWVAHPETEADKILIESSNKEISKLEFSYELDLEDDGAYFYCKMTQANEYGMEYEDQIQSDKVDLVYPPILDDFNYNNITFYNETVSVVISFLAKPMPQSEDINWNIQTGNVIQMLHPGNNADNFSALTMSKGPYANQYSVGLDILNLTSDAKIIIDIRNEVGNLKHEKIISYIPTPKLTIYTTRFPKWITIIIVSLVVVLALICLIFAFCRRRSTREKRLEEQNKATIGQYANNLAQENNQKKKKGQVMTNLEDFPEQNIPMLNNLDPSNETTRSDSSSSDRDEVDDTLTIEMDSIATTNDFNENPVPIPQPRSITTREHYQQSSSISRYVTNTTTTQLVSRLDPNILPSSFKPQEPHLSLRREKPAMTINTGGNTLPGYGASGGQFRLGGITQYPVLSPTPPGHSPYLPPGRKTSFIDYSNPKAL